MVGNRAACVLERFVGITSGGGLGPVHGRVGKVINVKCIWKAEVALPGLGG